MAKRLSDRLLAAGLGAAMKGASVLTRALPLPQPTLLVGPGSSARLGQAVAGFGHRRLLIVTDAVIARLGLLGALTQALDAAGADYLIYDEITPDAPIGLIEKGIALCVEHQCDALIAVGGGSSMDAAKTIALAVANDKHPSQLAGYLRGWRAPLPVYAVPTTAGTGSEVTVAAVISDPAAEKKYVVVDPRMVPKIAALDPSLMTGLPPPVTAATGMDALTHAVEAYLGHWHTAFSDGMALTAVGLIYENLRTVYRDGGNIEAREKMALASTYAGLAFTRANVGYVHAIAHQLGGKYHTPHGLANAIMLPYVLDFSLPAAFDRMADLARRAGIGSDSDSNEALAKKFVASVRALNRELGIPTQLDALCEEDITALARAACVEAYGYPVPRYMGQEECEAVIRQALPAAPKKGRRGRQDG